MKILDCSRCGSKELTEQAGFVICLYCQSRFVPQPDEIPKAQTLVGLGSDIDNLLAKCRTDPQNRRRYASLILDIDPTNKEARAYLA